MTGQEQMILLDRIKAREKKYGSLTFGQLFDLIDKYEAELEERKRDHIGAHRMSASTIEMLEEKLSRMRDRADRLEQAIMPFVSELAEPIEGTRAVQIVVTIDALREAEAALSSAQRPEGS